jgi:NitT/TauT family transport system ATP-binding protein
MDGHVFDPARLPDYVAGFAVKSALAFVSVDEV